MTEPYVGVPSTDHRAVCQFSPEHGDPPCGQPAAHHVAVEDPGYGLVGLPTCDQHLDIARAAGAFLDEHPYRGFCGFPSSQWDRPGKRCVLDGTGVRERAAERSEVHA